MASGCDDRALSRPSIPLADHSTSKPRSASSAVISSAVSLSSSIISTFVISSFPAAAEAFAPRPLLELKFRGIICMRKTKGIISTARERHGKERDGAAPHQRVGRRRGGGPPFLGQLKNPPPGNSGGP